MSMSVEWDAGEPQWAEWSWRVGPVWQDLRRSPGRLVSELLFDLQWRCQLTDRSNGSGTHLD